MPGASFARPLILLSRCIEHEACRYDGAMISSPFVRRMEAHVDFVTACPEVEIGLGVPRSPVRLVRGAGDAGPSMVQPSTGRDLTGQMTALAAERLSDLPDLDGALLKFRSPSCGISDVRVYATAGGGTVAGRGPGLFGAAVLASEPPVPVTHEGRLLDLELREHFLTAVFTLAGFRAARDACSGSRSLGPLVEFHARAKLLLSAHNREEGRRLGRLVASGGPLSEVLSGYRAGLARAVARPCRRGAAVDAMMHAFGHFREMLTRPEKAVLLDTLEDYRSGRAPMSACLSVLRAWTARSEDAYISSQLFLSPFPGALASTEDSGRGRIRS